MRRACLILFTAVFLPASAGALNGDCNEDGIVDLGELVRGVAIALDTRPLLDCQQFDANGDGVVDIAELVAAVSCALRPAATPTPTSTGSPPATGTETPTASRTPSPTVTATESAVSTSTATETAAVTPVTATATPTDTVAATESASPAQSATPTASPEETGTEISTSTPTPFPTGEVSTTPTPTVSGEASPTSTPTATPDGTHTPTATSASSPSATATHADTATPGATHTPTATSGSSPSATATHADTATPTATQSSTGTATSSPTPTPTPTATSTATQPSGEFRISTVDYRSQFKPAVAANDDGFVVAWQGNALLLPEDATDIFARRFDRFGAALGSELNVNQSLPGAQQSAAVAFAAPGFVVVWADIDGVLAQRFDQLGERAGSEFQVSTYTGGAADYTAIDAAPDGSFVVVWETLDQDGNGQGIFGRRYDSLGGSIGSEFQVNTFTNGAEQAPAIDVAGDGSFIVVWEGVGRGAVGQRFDSLGARVGTELVAPDLAAGAIGPFFPSVAILPGGDFVVTGVNMDATYSSGVFARRFSSTAAPVGESFQVNTFTYEAQKGATVAAGDDGGFAIVWRSNGQDGYQYGIFGQRFTSDGGRVGGEFQVNGTTSSDEREQAIAAGPGAGAFVVVWQGKGGKSYQGILGQRLD